MVSYYLFFLPRIFILHQVRWDSTCNILCSYGNHLIELRPNVVLKVIAFEVFEVSGRIPLSVLLFRYFHHLKKKYGDWFAFSSCHFPLVSSSSVCLPNVLGSLSNIDDEALLPSGLYKFLSSFSSHCIKIYFFLGVVLALFGMSPTLQAHDEIHVLLVNPLGI